MTPTRGRRALLRPAIALLAISLFLCTIGFWLGDGLDLHIDVKVSPLKTGWALTFARQSLFQDHQRFHISRTTSSSPSKWPKPIAFEGEYSAVASRGDQLIVFQPGAASLYSEAGWERRLPLPMDWNPDDALETNRGIMLVGRGEEGMRVGLLNEEILLPIAPPLSLKEEELLGPLRIAQVNDRLWILWGKFASSSSLSSSLHAAPIDLLQSPPVIGSVRALSPPHPFRRIATLNEGSSPESDPPQILPASSLIVFHAPARDGLPARLSTALFDGNSLHRPAHSITVPSSGMLGKEILSIDVFRCGPEVHLLLGGVGGIRLLRSRDPLSGRWESGGQIMGLGESREPWIIIWLSALLLLSCTIFFRGFRLLNLRMRRRRAH